MYSTFEISAFGFADYINTYFLSKVQWMGSLWLPGNIQFSLFIEWDGKCCIRDGQKDTAVSLKMTGPSGHIIV